MSRNEYTTIILDQGSGKHKDLYTNDLGECSQEKQVREWEKARAISGVILASAWSHELYIWKTAVYFPPPGKGRLLYPVFSHLLATSLPGTMQTLRFFQESGF